MVRNGVPHIRVVKFAATGAVLTLLLAGCGSGSGSSNPSTTSSTPTSSSPSPSTTTTSSQPSSSSPTQAKAADGFCKAADIRLSLGRGDGAAGTVFRPLIMTNVSDHPCTIQGFPGVSYVAGADGHQVGKDAFRDGTKGEVIVLKPGTSASSDVGFVRVQNYEPSVCKPTPVTGIRVYLPQDTASKFLEAPGTGCTSDTVPGYQLTVKTAHPGVAG